MNFYKPISWAGLKASFPLLLAAENYRPNGQSKIIGLGEVRILFLS